MERLGDEELETFQPLLEKYGDDLGIFNYKCIAPKRWLTFRASVSLMIAVLVAVVIAYSVINNNSKDTPDLRPLFILPPTPPQCKLKLQKRQEKNTTKTRTEERVLDHLIVDSSGNCDRCLYQAHITRQQTDIQALELYEGLNFPEEDNLELAVVKLNDPLTNHSRWKQENKLRIFLVPHSHNDPGWGNTFEGYYRQSTKYILKNMLQFLNQDSNLKMIWMEMSFFNIWWETLPYGSKIQVRKLIENRQLEFVNGGWVMPDEANVHYFSFLSQLIEGHQWLHHHLNYTPTNSWTIDPFGLSSTFEYLIRRSGMKRNVFLRTHYVVKNWFSKTKNLEFFWRQEWAKDSSTDMMCYMMPYGSYDTADTCGPGNQVNICTSFKKEEPWVDLKTIENRSMALLNQYRLKSMEFQTNNLLVPIGGDFQWSSRTEWTDGINNLKAMIEFFRSKPDLNVEVKFATLNEYFESVEREIAGKKFSPKTFSGDFFPYSDSKLDYWSGYFTSRMYHKVTERRLMTLVRSSQILYAMLVGEVTRSFGHPFFPLLENMLVLIVNSRRNFSIFQHHDGISGTSKTFVVSDFEDKMRKAIMVSQYVIQQALYILSKAIVGTLRIGVLYNTKPRVFYEPIHGTNLDWWRPKLIILNSSHPSVVIGAFNPLEFKRVELIRVNVSTSKIKVFDMNGLELDGEIYPSPVEYSSPAPFPDAQNSYQGHSRENFILAFVGHFEPLQIRHFRIVYSGTYESKSDSVKINAYNFGGNAKVLEVLQKRFQVVEVNSNGSELTEEKIQISNRKFKLTFTRNGKLQQLNLNGRIYPLSASFHYYTTNKSGLYSFFPDGPAKPVEVAKSPPCLVIIGRLMSYVEVFYQHIRHRVTLYDHQGLSSNSIDIKNIVNLTNMSNYELVMRMITSINSGDIFYTDSNSFQMTKRKRFSKLPIQGNYYPVASAAFIEDSKTRLTLLAGQPCGGTSLRSGEFEVMIDRITNQDDHHGIGQGGTDNVATLTKFRILLEEVRNEDVLSVEQRIPLLSMGGHHQLTNLLHPIQVFVKRRVDAGVMADYQITGSTPLPCDMHVVGIFPLPKYVDASEDAFDTKIFMEETGEFGMVINRLAIDRRYGCDCPGVFCACAPNRTFSASQIFRYSIRRESCVDSLSFNTRKDMRQQQCEFPLAVTGIQGIKLTFAVGGTNVTKTRTLIDVSKFKTKFEHFGFNF